MAATPQPIGASSNEDSTMGNMGSYNNGSFNPASYTRQFLGTPLSWKPGSFGSGFRPDCSPSQFFSSIDTFGRLPNSLDSDRGHMKLDPYISAREQEFAQNFTCCGLHLTDLHAVVEHFEVVHVVVADPQAVINNKPNAQYANAFSTPSSSSTSQSAFVGHFDPDDMEIDDEDGAQSTASSSGPSGPHTPPNAESQNKAAQNALSKVKTAAPLQVGTSPPISAFDTTIVHARLNGGPMSPMSAFPSRRGSEMLGGYSAYSDFAALQSPGGTQGDNSDPSESEPNSPAGCVPPALVFSSAKNSPSLSRAGSGSGTFSSAIAGSSTAATSSPVLNSATSSTSGLSLGNTASSLLLSKPFRCPKPNCNKSYKQANGLKYHMTHGSCNFAPPKDLEQVQALLARKRSELAQAAGGDGDAEEAMELTEGELREVEREAERQLRPFACSVGDCSRRYKNMNGLRYHYQHSGEHGAVGLALLASGQHECLSHAHKANQAAARSVAANANRAQKQQQMAMNPQLQALQQQFGLSPASSPSPSPVISAAQPAFMHDTLMSN